LYKACDLKAKCSENHMQKRDDNEGNQGEQKPDVKETIAAVGVNLVKGEVERAAQAVTRKN
jgi:hypothetical protein